MCVVKTSVIYTINFSFSYFSLKKKVQVFFQTYDSVNISEGHSKDINKYNYIFLYKAILVILLLSSSYK